MPSVETGLIPDLINISLLPKLGKLFLQISALENQIPPSWTAVPANLVNSAKTALSNILQLPADGVTAGVHALTQLQRYQRYSQDGKLLPPMASIKLQQQLHQFQAAVAKVIQALKDADLTGVKDDLTRFSQNLRDLHQLPEEDKQMFFAIFMENVKMSVNDFLTEFSSKV